MENYYNELGILNCIVEYDICPIKVLFYTNYKYSNLLNIYKNNPSYVFILLFQNEIQTPLFLWIVDVQFLKKSTYLYNKINEEFIDSVPNRWNSEINNFDLNGNGAYFIEAHIPEDIQLSGHIVAKMKQRLDTLYNIPTIELSETNIQELKLLIEEPYRNLIDFLGFEINYELIYNL